MVKRYIQSYISMKYVFVLPGLALAVFVCAFLYTSTGNEIMRYIGIGFGCVLAVVMIFYYKEKFTLRAQLKKVTNLNEFEQAVMIGQAFFLEKRMLGYGNKKLFELTYPQIQAAEFTEKTGGKMFLNLSTEQGLLPVEMALRDQAARVASFLQARNPELKVSGIEPSGNGTLRSIDPYRNEKG